MADLLYHHNMFDYGKSHAIHVYSIGHVCDITETQMLVEFNLIKVVLAERVQTSCNLKSILIQNFSI